MRFLIDNALSPSIAEGLRKNGHDALHVRNIGLSSSPDRTIFDLAMREGRVLVSADTDFGEILALGGHRFPSFILFRTSNKKPAYLLALLLANLPHIEQECAQGHILVFEETRIRARTLPIE